MWHGMQTGKCGVNSVLRRIKASVSKVGARTNVILSALSVRNKQPVQAELVAEFDVGGAGSLLCPGVADSDEQTAAILRQHSVACSQVVFSRRCGRAMNGQRSDPPPPARLPPLGFHCKPGEVHS